MGVSVNSLGFTGTLLVKHEAQLATVKQVGPMRVLLAVGRPRTPLQNLRL